MTTSAIHSPVDIDNSFSGHALPSLSLESPSLSSSGVIFKAALQSMGSPRSCPIWITGVAAPARADPITGHRVGTVMFPVAMLQYSDRYINHRRRFAQCPDTANIITAISVDTIIVPLLTSSWTQSPVNPSQYELVHTSPSSHRTGVKTPNYQSHSINGTKASVIAIGICAAWICGTVRSDENIINKQTHAVVRVMIERIQGKRKDTDWPA